ncbi:hypothetical protein HK096_007154, partial [Nowakowskiella sp. JEL0078]
MDEFKDSKMIFVQRLKDFELKIKSAPQYNPISQSIKQNGIARFRNSTDMYEWVNYLRYQYEVKNKYPEEVLIINESNSRVDIKLRVDDIKQLMCPPLKRLTLRKCLNSSLIKALCDGFKNSNITEIDLSENNCLTISNIKDIVNAVPQKNLTQIHLRNAKIGKRASFKVYSLIEKCPQLELLNLSSNKVGNINTLTSKLKCRGESSSSKKLHIDLSSNNIPTNDQKVIMDAFKIISENAPNHEISIDFDTDEKNWPEYILEMQKSKIKGISKILLKTNTPATFFIVTIKNETFDFGLKILILKDCYLKDDGMIGIKAAFKRFLLLTDIDLSGNEISERGAETIALGLKAAKNPNIRKFIISNNKIGNQGSRAIISAFFSNDLGYKLFQLDFSKNKITCLERSDLMRYLESNICKLNILSLRSNELHNTDAIKIAHLLKIGNFELTELDLSYNKFEDEGFNEIAMSLVENKRLQSLKLLGIEWPTRDGKGRGYEEMAKPYKSMLESLTTNETLEQLYITEIKKKSNKSKLLDQIKELETTK